MLRLGCNEKLELYDPTKDRGSTTPGTLSAENAMPDREAHQTDEIEVVDEEGNAGETRAALAHAVAFGNQFDRPAAMGIEDRIAAGDRLRGGGCC